MRVIESDNLSFAWAKATRRCLNTGEITPLLVHITGFAPDGAANEDLQLRAQLDKLLKVAGHQSCETVANTIFPASQWNPRRPRDALFERYTRTYPGLKRNKENKLGTYFGRLTGCDAADRGGNQLNFILDAFARPAMRRSVLQASIFDPARDHTRSAQKGFPCLQHVSFAKHDGDKLNVNAFYALQYLVERGYGNYLGLARLGAFMARELDLKLDSLSIFIGVAQRGPGGKVKDLHKIVDGVGGNDEDE